MAFDGITIANIRSELDRTLSGGHLAKIIQPEPDELILTVKNNSKQYRVLLSAGASLPLAYIASENKQAPMNAPNFCMLLRKHLSGGLLKAVTQPGLERVLSFHIEHRNELGDLMEYRLILELMGKHSNLILVNDENNIIDSIKRISFNVSSVREVLPGRAYFIPQTQNKFDPLAVTEDEFAEAVCSRELPLFKALYTSLTGFSPVIAEELCMRAGIDADAAANALTEPERLHLYHTFQRLIEDVRAEKYTPNIVYKDEEPFEYASLELSQFPNLKRETFDSISALIEHYYAEKELRTRIRQRSTDLRKIVNTALERNGRTLSLQEKQMHDTEKREKYRIYGELLNTYGYSLAPGAKELETINYYTNEPVTVPLDPLLSAAENAKHYFARYNKLKRTAEALTERILGTKSDIEHLESISASLDIARDEADLQEIRDELADFGYLKHKGPNGKKKKEKARPLHYVSSDGFDIYVGKNNYQNEQVTFKIGSSNDMWFHANDLPGSHVLVKSDGREIPDSTYEEAGRLAAFYSKAKTTPKVEIDYTLRKNLHKGSGGRPGFVVYHTNYSMMSRPDIHDIREADN
uniref:Rqc2 family fibronectin-binding protein n=1 Tax=Eubacterium cellulosolvens TaxID=29322 RepID=UPI0004877714|nr:NFACT RNA binding domain-containing protein [[Eubacterium] cellulosolvens]